MNDILIVNFYFGDSRIPTSRMAKDVVDYLEKKKINLKIFTSNSFYKNLRNQNYKKKKFKKVYCF